MDDARTHIHRPVRGFTLIEISIVVGIVLMLLTLGIGLMNAQLSSASYSITKQRQTAIKDALVAYLGANRRLPCPYVPVAGTVVTGLDPAQSGTPLACPTFGVVPFATLGHSREIGEDGWGNLFSYRVYTDAAPSCPSIAWDWGNATCFGEGKDGVTPAKTAQRINDGTVGSAILITDKSIAVVISHGANGLGAWATQGTRNAAPTTCEEAHNAAGTTPPSGCAPATNTYYKGERSDNDDVVAYLSAGDALQTLVKQGAIKSATAKVNDDLQTLSDMAVAQKRSNINIVSVLGIITISSSDCQATANTGDMSAALASMRDPWGQTYGFAQGPATQSSFPICIFSRAGSADSCSVSGTTCSSTLPVICKTLDKATFNAYLARAGASGCS